jgi:hypothetical protein
VNTVAVQESADVLTDIELFNQNPLSDSYPVFSSVFFLARTPPCSRSRRGLTSMKWLRS